MLSCQEVCPVVTTESILCFLNPPDRLLRVSFAGQENIDCADHVTAQDMYRCCALCRCGKELFLPIMFSSCVDGLHNDSGVPKFSCQLYHSIGAIVHIAPVQ